MGVNSPDEATKILAIHPVGVDAFSVTYADYAPNDPMYDLSLSLVTITYRIVSSVVKASQPLPAGVKDRLRAVASS